MKFWKKYQNISAVYEFSIKYKPTKKYWNFIDLGFFFFSNSKYQRIKLYENTIIYNMESENLSIYVL